MPKLWYALAFIVFFILGASFMVWRDEHHKVVDLTVQLEKERDHNKPKLSGEIENIIYAPAGSKNEDSIIVLMAMITNIGAPSIARDLEVTVKIGDKQIKGTPIPMPAIEIKLWKQTEAQGEGLILKPEDFLPRKCIAQPIANGGGAGGFMLMLFHNVSNQQLASNGLVILSFKDILDREYTCQYDIKLNMNRGGDRPG